MYVIIYTCIYVVTFEGPGPGPPREELRQNGAAANIPDLSALKDAFGAVADKADLVLRAPKDAKMPQQMA